MTLFTIGYEGLNERQFAAYLVHHQIDVVADVRKLPLSRKKGFSKTALQEMLTNRDIEYINFQGLGAPKEIRDKLYKSGNYSRFFREYQSNIADKTDLLETIHLLLTNGKNVTLLCFERDPKRCHRKVVAEEIKKLDGNGLEVKHIVPLN
jgi:uncharacterized protein (DUF488 family)